MISVVVNCHNGLPYLKEALDSVIAQTDPDWEIVFWDNASVPRMEDLVLSYKDSRIRYFYNEHLVPLGEARNRALDVCKGEYIAFLDSDDYWMPEKLELQRKLMQEHVRAGIVYTDSLIVHDRKVLQKVFSQAVPADGAAFPLLLSRYFLVMSSVMIRRSALESLATWFDPEYEIIEEYDLFLRLAVGWELQRVPKVLTAWRWHAGSTTMRKRRLISIEKRRLLKRLQVSHPAIMRLHRDAVMAVRGKILVSAAINAYQRARPASARRALRRSRLWTLKGVFVFFATFFPKDIVDSLYRKLKGNPLV